MEKLVHERDLKKGCLETSVLPGRSLTKHCLLLTSGTCSSCLVYVILSADL